MTFLSRLVSLLMCPMVIAVSCAAQTASAAPASIGKVGEEQALKAFAALHPIDAHVHVFKTDPAFQEMLERLNVKLLNILVIDDTLPYRKQLQPQIDDALALMRSSHGHIALCTTFDPIYRDIAQHGKTLLSHQAEPDVAWGPPDPADPSWSYYQENPQWYVGNKSGFPSKQAILEARDHVLANNPNLRMVGVHLGSMERDLDNIARHLEKYPKFAIDTAARMDYLMMMSPEKVRAFLIKYQDRVVYGTDLDLFATADVAEALKEWRSTYARDWKFLATGETFSVEGKQVRGLNLPRPVLQKIFRSNALHWIPGL